MKSQTISRQLRRLGDPSIAEHSQRFFKTGKGEYGEGDHFLGIRVPVLRRYVRTFRDTELQQILELLQSRYHEERLFALLLMVERFRRGTQAECREIYDAYMRNLRFVNNWDLVDSSADKIAGAWLQNRSRRPLYRLAQSRFLWRRRVAIIATFHFIRAGDVEDALRISCILLEDEEDLIQKAVGWMLREIGKRNPDAEVAFLEQNHAAMPRTMLRYAIEHFPEPQRKSWLQR